MGTLNNHQPEFTNPYLDEGGPSLPFPEVTSPSASDNWDEAYNLEGSRGPVAVPLTNSSSCYGPSDTSTHPNVNSDTNGTMYGNQQSGVGMFLRFRSKVTIKEGLSSKALVGREVEGTASPPDLQT